jgi:hypothetical protein
VRNKRKAVVTDHNATWLPLFMPLIYRPPKQHEMIYGYIKKTQKKKKKREKKEKAKKSSYVSDPQPIGRPARDRT